NSPSAVLWRIEGIDVPSPNHWATLGTSGGPISMLNTNNLRTSDFLSGAFPAEYGNVTGAVFDLKLRNGNASKYEFLGQIGFNGFEAGAEGPLRNLGQNASFLVNFRYSTLAVVNALGINFGTGFAVPEYQDLNFKVNIPTKNAGRFSLWGLGGLSNIQFLAEESEDNFFTQGEENLRSGTNTGMLGFNHLYFFDETSSSSLSLFASYSNNSTTREEILDANGGNLFEESFISRNVQSKYAVNWTYNKKFNARNRLKTGINYELYDLSVVDSILIGDDIWFKELDFVGNTSLLRAFAQWKHKLNDKLTLNAGLNSLWFTLNNSTSLEPRLSLAYQLNPKSTLAAGYGRHAQLHPLPIYFSKDDRATAEENMANEQLDFMKSDHFVLSYSLQATDLLKISSSVYYQNLFSIASDPDQPDFSLINFGADFGFPNRTGLVNDGRGSNYGVELTINRSLSNGFYYLVTGSLFNSTYEGLDGADRNTYYNSNYVFNTLMGKEFTLSSKLTLTLDGRFTYSGGRRFTPIDLEASIEAGRTVRDFTRIYEARLAPYIRPDVKIGLRINGNKSTQTFSVDLQNFIGRENELNNFFSAGQGRIRTTRQRGFFPDVRYQILF
ncbi:MAG: TonB-dependent receptor, partial [Bacteroidota bacterium]